MCGILHIVNKPMEAEVAATTGVRGAIGTARLAARLVADAARREFSFTVGLSVLAALLTAAELLVGRQLVEILTTDGAEASADDLVPWLLLLGVLLIATALVTTTIGELRILLNELVHRRAVDQLLEAATAAELEAFEDPEFHDQVQRAREHADTYAWQVVWGLVTLLSTLLSIVAVVAVLLTVAPLLVPVAALAYVPIAAVGIRNTRSLYQLRYELAELDRDHAYHERLLTGRLEAKEVRAFDLSDHLRGAHDRLFVERIRNTRRVVRRRTFLALVGSSVTAVITVSALAVVMLLALDERISVADAAVAIVSLQQISGRLRGLADATTSMVEGVTFLRDFEAFQARAEISIGRVFRRRPPASPSLLLLDRVSYQYPTATAPALTDVGLRGAPGGGGRHRRAEWFRQVNAGEVALWALFPHLRADLLGRR